MVNSTPTQRNVALDVMRGLTIAAMILVNNPGSWDYVYWPLAHANWHGYTPTDLVFPFFLFITGSAMFFGLSRFDYQPSSDALKKLLKRVLIIFGIGLFLHAYPFIEPFSNLRIMGVLQRIAIAYGIAALAVLYLSNRGVILFTVAILLLYWLILIVAGGVDPYSLEGNCITPIDRLILGTSHMWDGKGIAFDPEGLMSTLPAIANVTAGFLTTKYLVSLPNNSVKIQKMLMYGVGLIVLGHLWELVLPINKSIWTSSYVVVTTGWALVILGALISLCGSNIGLKIARPFQIYGSNPLFIYGLSWVWMETYWIIPINYNGVEISLGEYLPELFFNFFGRDGNANYWASHSFALFHVVLFWVISWALYKKRIFIKI